MGRRSDMYVFCCSSAHQVAPKDKYLAFVSTTVETDTPEAELAPGGRAGLPLCPFVAPLSSCSRTLAVFK